MQSLSFLVPPSQMVVSYPTELSKFVKILKSNREIKQIYKNRFFSGLTYSEGAFSYIVTIYIIKVFSDSVSLGIFTSIFSFISCITGVLFAKCIKQKHYNSIIKVSMVFTIASLCAMIYKCTFITIVLFNLCQTFSKELMSLINTNSCSDISNLALIRKEYKVEYWLGTEASLFFGRIISNTLFILMAFAGADVMIYIFVVFLIIYAGNSVKLQRVIGGNE